MYGSTAVLLLTWHVNITISNRIQREVLRCQDVVAIERVRVGRRAAAGSLRLGDAGRDD